MSRKHKIIIPFKGLAEGNHEFETAIDTNFFNELDYSEFKSGDIKISIFMEKRLTHLNLKIQFNGLVNVMCDRCLDYFNTEVEFDGELFVRYSYQEQEPDGEIMVISPDDNELDLSHYIYESIFLSLPYQNVHPLKNGRSTCNKEMIKKLKQYEVVKPDDEDVNLIDEE